MKRDAPPTFSQPSPVSFPGLLWGLTHAVTPEGGARREPGVGREGNSMEKDWKGKGREGREGLFYLLL